MSGTDPGPGPRLPTDTEVDPPKPAERHEPASGVSRAVREVPTDLLDEMEEDLGGRPRVHVIETAETHGENGARYAAIGAGVPRERVKTEPNAKILVAPTTVPLEPVDGRALQKEAAERLKAIVEAEEARSRRRAPTEVSTHEKKRRFSLTAVGLLVGAIVIALLVGGMIIGKLAEEGKAKPTPSGVASTPASVAPPSIPSEPMTVNPQPTATLISPPPSSTAAATSASGAKPHGPKHGSEPGHTAEPPMPPVPSATTATPPASVAPVPTPAASASSKFSHFVEQEKKP